MKKIKKIKIKLNGKEKHIIANLKIDKLINDLNTELNFIILSLLSLTIILIFYLYFF